MKLLLFQLTLFGALRWMYDYGKISFLCLTFENIMSILFHFFRFFARISFKGYFYYLIWLPYYCSYLWSFFWSLCASWFMLKIQPIFLCLLLTKNVKWSAHCWIVWIGYRGELMTLIDIFYRYRGELMTLVDIFYRTLR